jgi:hypothetical protein
MVGRAAEPDAMPAAYASARTGESQLVLITDQAGIGKDQPRRRPLRQRRRSAFRD